MRPNLSPLEYGAYGTSFNDETEEAGGPQMAPSWDSGSEAINAESWNGADMVVDVW